MISHATYKVTYAAVFYLGISLLQRLWEATTAK